MIMDGYFKCLITLCMLSVVHMHCSENSPPNTKQPLSLAQSISVGGLAGAAEVTFPGQILTYAMAQKIREKPFILSHSYRGFQANALGDMSITAAQKVIYTGGVQWGQKLKGAKLSEWENTGISFAAGVGGAVMDTPSNAVQLYLQDEKHAGKSTIQACKELGRKSFRGFTANAFLKEGPFAVAWLMLAQKGELVAQEYVGKNLGATILGGLPVGIVTAVATQPGAVIRNKMQNDSSKITYKTTLQTAVKICKDEGSKALFKGLPERGVRVGIAVPLLAIYANLLEKYICKETTA